jgi:hypothetical protein
MNRNSHIFHYTTIAGLIGIISKNEIWASDCRFLNDGTELKYAFDIFNDEIKKLDLQPLDDHKRVYVIPLSALKKFRMFVTCFCRNGDLLSQWRGYGLDQGYSLGFSVMHLRGIKFNGNTIDKVTQVQYGITNPADYFQEELERATHTTKHPDVSIWSASREFLPRLACVKHPSFKEEQEWRLLKQFERYELQKDQCKVEFRPSSLGPVPYITLPFDLECLREVIIGPGSYTEDRREAIQSMLLYYGYSGVTVRISNIPYRK